MWTVILQALKKPSVIAIIVLTLLCGGLYVNNARQDVKIAELGTKIVKIESNYTTCKSNETTLKDAVDVANGQSDAWVTSNEALRVQLNEALGQVTHWQDLYDNKICFNNNDETPVVPSQGKVVNDEKSAKAVDRLNGIFN